jgi:hypothetical protein
MRKKGGQVHLDHFTMRSMPLQSKLILTAKKGGAGVLPAPHQGAKAPNGPLVQGVVPCLRGKPAHRYALCDVRYCVSRPAHAGRVLDSFLHHSLGAHHKLSDLLRIRLGVLEKLLRQAPRVSGWRSSEWHR